MTRWDPLPTTVLSGNFPFRVSKFIFRNARLKSSTTLDQSRPVHEYLRQTLLLDKVLIFVISNKVAVDVPHFFFFNAYLLRGSFTRHCIVIEEITSWNRLENWRRAKACQNAGRVYGESRWLFVSFCITLWSKREDYASVMFFLTWQYMSSVLLLQTMPQF